MRGTALPPPEKNMEATTDHWQGEVLGCNLWSDTVARQKEHPALESQPQSSAEMPSSRMVDLQRMVDWGRGRGCGGSCLVYLPFTDLCSEVVVGHISSPLPAIPLPKRLALLPEFP